MLGLVLALILGLFGFTWPRVYPSDEHQFLNGVAPQTLALLNGNGSYAPVTELIRVADLIDLVGELLLCLFCFYFQTLYNKLSAIIKFYFFRKRHPGTGTGVIAIWAVF